MWGSIVSLLFFVSRIIAEVPTAKCPFDESFDQCFKGFIGNTIELIGTRGIPEVKIPPLDPFQVPNLKATFNSVIMTGGVQTNNVVVTGIKGAKIVSFVTNIRDFNHQNVLVADVVAHVPRVHVKGGWEQATLVTMGKRLADAGTFSFTVDNVQVNLIAQGRLKKHNNTYYYPELVKVSAIKPIIGNVHIQASDVLKNDPVLSKTVINMANTFWRILYDEVHPIVTQQIEFFSLKYINAYARNHLHLLGTEVHAMLNKNSRQ